MVIAWKGKGFLVPVIFLGNVFVSTLSELPADESNSLFATSTLLSLWLPGIYLNRKTPEFSFREAHWGFRAPHTFFFIPFQYWGLFSPVALLLHSLKSS